MLQVSIINIGDELLIGQVVNTNATTMSQMLTSHGMGVRRVTTIADAPAAIRAAIEAEMGASDVVLVTGGLGPTKDDMTKTTLCEMFGSELYENAEALANIQRIFAARGYELTPLNRRQAEVPRCCTMINNVLGTAPCMWFEADEGRKVIVSLPGVPFEMSNLMETEVVPRLMEHFGCDAIVNKNILVQGIGESFLSDLVETWELALPDSVRLAYLPSAGMVKLRLTARGRDREALHGAIDAAVAGLYPIAGQYIVGEDAESLAEVVARTMTGHGVTLATAESCTGGLLAEQLTTLPGASCYYRGGVVAYCNEIKERLLGVSHSTLETETAVSEAVACAMAEGVRQRLGADYGVATTGVAGPDGGTERTPVGTVWTAVATPTKTLAYHHKFGDRRRQTVERACNAVWSELVKLMKEEQ